MTSRQRIPTRKYIHWNGETWSDWDGVLPDGNVIEVPVIEGSGALDPSIHVITWEESRATVELQHQNYRKGVN